MSYLQIHGLLAPNLFWVLDGFAIKLFVFVKIGNQGAVRKRLGRLENSILDEMRFNVAAHGRIRMFAILPAIKRNLVRNYSTCFINRKLGKCQPTKLE